MKNKILPIIFLTAVFLLSACHINQSKEEQPLVPVSETAEDILPLPYHTAKTADNQNTPVPYYNTYTVNLDVNPVRRSISGIEKVKYKNTTGQILDEIYMNVYLNAFSKKSDYLPYSLDIKEQLFPYGEDYSEFRINSLTINNEPVSYSLNNTVLTIKLQKPLEIEEETDIVLAFECYIPKTCTRFGGNDHSMWAAGLLPTIALHSNESWNKSYYYPTGDFFQNTISNYEVTVTMPETYSIAATGTGMMAEQNGKKIAVISAKMVRDFAFSISSHFQKATIETKDGIPINLYYYNTTSSNVTLLLNTAKNNMEFYTEHIGSYPYPELDMVESSLFYKGDMEFPQFVLVDSSYINQKQEIGLPSFQFGKQWFSNLIGTDSINESWLSQGLIGFMQSYHSYSTKELDEIMRSEYDLLKEALQKEEYPSLNNPLSAYTDLESFYNVQYRRSRLMFYELYKKIGGEKFSQLLKDYYTAFSFKTASSADFFDLCEKVSSKNLDTFFKEWLTDPQMPPFK